MVALLVVAGAVGLAAALAGAYELLAAGLVLIVVALWVGFDTALLTFIILFPLVSIYSDFQPTSPAGSAKDVLFGVLVLVCVCQMFLRQRLWGGLSPILFATAIYVVVVGLMAAVSPSPIVAALGFRSLAMYAALVFMIPSCSRDVHLVPRIRKSLEVSVLVISGYEMLKWLIPSITPLNPYLTGYSAVVAVDNRLHWDELTLVLAAILPLVAVLRPRPWRLDPGLLGIGLGLVVLLLAENKTALIGLLVSATILAALRTTKPALRWVGTIGGLAAIVLVAYIAGPALLDLAGTSYSGRAAEFGDYIPLILAKPWGNGTGSVSLLLYSDRYAAFIGNVFPLVPAIHNSVLVIVLELGIQGIMAMVILVGAVVWQYRRTKTSPVHTTDSHLAVASVAVVGAVAVEMLFSPVILSSQLMFYFWLALGLSGVSYASRSNQAQRRLAVAKAE